MSQCLRGLVASLALLGDGEPPKNVFPHLALRIGLGALDVEGRDNLGRVEAAQVRKPHGYCVLWDRPLRTIVSNRLLRYAQKLR